MLNSGLQYLPWNMWSSVRMPSMTACTLRHSSQTPTGFVLPAKMPSGSLPIESNMISAQVLLALRMLVTYCQLCWRQSGEMLLKAANGVMYGPNSRPISRLSRSVWSPTSGRVWYSSRVPVRRSSSSVDRSPLASTRRSSSDRRDQERSGRRRSSCCPAACSGVAAASAASAATSRRAHRTAIVERLRWSCSGPPATQLRSVRHRAPSQSYLRRN